MPKERMSDERLMINQLSEAIAGLTCAINRQNDLTGEWKMSVRMLESSLRRAQRASRRLRLLASAFTRLDESTER